MISNISCNSDYSKVRILKLDGQYYYTGVLGCGADKNKILEDKNVNYIVDKEKGTINKGEC